MPVIDELTAPFWAATRRGELVVQRCSSCGSVQHPPAPQCLSCLSLELGWLAVSGRGVVHEATTMHEARVYGFEDRTPYTCVSVELDDAPGIYLLGNLVGAPGRTGQALVGVAVEVAFEPLTGDITLAQFTPADGAR